MFSLACRVRDCTCSRLNLLACARGVCGGDGRSLFTSPVVVVFLGLVGPACGYYGATKLMKCPTLVYVIVLFMKTISLVRARLPRAPEVPARFLGHVLFCSTFYPQHLQTPCLTASLPASRPRSLS